MPFPITQHGEMSTSSRTDNSKCLHEAVVDDSFYFGGIMGTLHLSLWAVISFTLHSALHKKKKEKEKRTLDAVFE